MNTSSRGTKKVYHLRKTVTSAVRKQRQQKQQTIRQTYKYNNNNINNSNMNNDDNSIIQHVQNNSFIKKSSGQQIYNNVNDTTRRQVEGPQLTVNTLFLNFEQKLNYIQTRQIKLKNIGSSAIYYQWKLKNESKISSYAIKDSRPKFFCHYTKNSIKPSEQITFVFSFLSQIPGYFTQQCDLITQPQLLTPIPTIRLQGKAYIEDQWSDQRQQFLRQLQYSSRLCSVEQTLNDVVDMIKLPEPERPDVKDVKIAEKLFQNVNENLGLYFNPYVHGWFNQLYQQIWLKQYPQSQVQQIYWDQSISSFKQFILSCNQIDQIQKSCYLQRLQHYTHLSTFPLPQKSMLYQQIYNMLSNAAYHLGGDYVDAIRKQLDMWEIPFREPLENDTEDDLKSRKEQIQKIKAEWLKRTKKKKWGEEQDRQMVEEFKNKVKNKVNQQILASYQNYQSKAEFIRIKKQLQLNKFDQQKYFLFLQRLKNVKQYPIQGKKVLLKFNLKLKQNCQTQLKQLQEYLIKKQQQKKRIQEEKKNQDAKKKKAPKKKGQKQQQQQKPLQFDFSSILDQQNWNGFIETFKTIQQKSPYLILIGCTYRDRIGRVDDRLSVKFLLQHIKHIEPSIQFMSHSQLLQIQQGIQNQTISQSSVFLVQNLNFLPSETLVCEQIQVYDQQGNKKQKITKRNVIYPQIKNNLIQWTRILDVIVDQDRFLSKSSGISSYSNKQVVLGNSWWNYVGLMCRVTNQYVILGGDFNPQSYLLLSRLLSYCKKVYLTGKIGFKFSLVANNCKQKKLVNFLLSSDQQTLIRQIIQSSNIEDKLIIPQIFKFYQKSGQNPDQKYIIFRSLSQEQQNLQQLQVIDIDQSISEQLLSQPSFNGHLFMIGKCHILQYDENKGKITSTASILKTIYKLQQQKRARHTIENNTPAGIDYDKDIVFYMIGIDNQFVEKIELKQKKNKKLLNKQQSQQQGQQQQQQQGEQEEEQQPQGQEQGQKKKVNLIADFILGCQATVRKILSAKFDYGFKNISKYPKPIQL